MEVGSVRSENALYLSAVGSSGAALPAADHVRGLPGETPAILFHVGGRLRKWTQSIRLRTSPVAIASRN